MTDRFDKNFSLDTQKQEVETDLDNRSAQGIDKEAVSYWNKCLEVIRDNVGAQAFKTWFLPLKGLKWNKKCLTIEVPSQFFLEWIEENYNDLLESTVYRILGRDAKLEYQISIIEEDDSLESRKVLVRKGFKPGRGSQTAIQFGKEQSTIDTIPASMNPRYTFDNFISGESNQLAKSAAMAVAQNPGGTRFNPLVIYGDTGLGKTHVAQAVGNYLQRTNSRLRVLYTNSEHFTMEFINAIQNNRVNDFINFYRSIDVLIVDDIQFFAGKEKTQDNFFHTFNALHQAGKQLILTSDKPPRELHDVDERLISRFQWGLTVDIQHPDLEMRMAILKRKSEDEGVILTDETVDYLARNVKSSIRELEGILISLIAKVTLDKRRLDLDLAKEVVHGIAKKDPRPVTMDKIKDYVSEYYNQPIDILESKSRKHEIALARQMAMYLAKQMTAMSLKSIGASFGGRDHSTVLHSFQTIQNYLETDKKVKRDYENLFATLKKSNS